MEASATLLKKGAVKSCGCARRNNSRSLDMLDLVGKVYGKLTVTAVAHSKNYVYDVVCSCGNTAQVKRYDLLSGHTKTCGCWQRPLKHGATDTKLYSIWLAMKARCLNPNATNYKWYGGRGIAVCSEWLDFTKFKSDMGEPPFDGATLDRKDTLKDYSASNCKWSSMVEQQNNRRSSVRYVYRGVNFTLKSLSEELGIKESTLAGRLYTGMTIEEAATGLRETKPVRKRLAGNLLYREE